MDPDRRHAPRHHFIAEAEVTDTLSEAKLKGRISDLSNSGCFVDMLNPSPVGTLIRITISHDGMTFTATGKVAFILQSMGMGIIFTQIDPGQLPTLQKWLAS